jgi:ribosomal-protein-serine acetyltransferase
MFSFRVDDGLDLRLIEERHAEEYFQLTEQNRDYLRQWLSYIDAHKSVEDIRKCLRGNLVGFANGTRLNPGIWFEGKLVGIAGYDRIDFSDRNADLSYWLTARLQGKGIVTRCCRALLDYAFGELGLKRVEVRCASENKKSRAIPERLGFKEEGIIRQAQWICDHFVDHVVYGMLTTEWRSTANSRIFDEVLVRTGTETSQPSVERHSS